MKIQYVVKEDIICEPHQNSSPFLNLPNYWDAFQKFLSTHR